MPSPGEGEAPKDELRSPLDDIFVAYLMSQRRESPHLDFKLILDVSRQRFAEVAKDIFAMANWGGGYILVGFMEKATGGFEPVGLPPDFHIDQADLQQKFNAYCRDPIAVGYREFDHDIADGTRKFALLYAPPSTAPLRPATEGFTRSATGRENRVFGRGDLLIRRGTQSVKASGDEEEFIKRRCEETEYRIGLISGNPDRIQETLLSNLFEVRQVPSTVYSARLAREQIPFAVRMETSFVVQDPYLYSFRDPRSEPLKPFVVAQTMAKHEVHEWLKDKDRRNIVLWLLDSGLIWEARRRGMFEWKKQVFYPLRHGETMRHEPWPGMARQATRQVATMMYAAQLGGQVGVHPAVDVHFGIVGEKLYLRLLPTFVLTSDGRRVRTGDMEGTVVTSLTHDEYNMAYVRNLMFWMSRLGTEGGRLRLLDGDVEVDAEAMKSQIEVGLRADRPGLAAVISGPQETEEAR